MAIEILAKVRGLGDFYADGLERLSVDVKKTEAIGLGFRDGARTAIDLQVDGDFYHAGLRTTLAMQLVWICPDLIDSKGTKTTLANVLAMHGFGKNQTVVLEADENCIRLLPMPRISRGIISQGPHEPAQAPSAEQPPPKLGFRPPLRGTQTRQSTLSEFFQKPRYEKALARYVEVAQARGWGIDHKLHMYNLAKAAFDSDLVEDEKRRAFNQIYKNLKGWRVFRKAPLGYWSAEEIFTSFTNYAQVFSRESNITLLTLRPNSDESEKILAGLDKLRNLKQTKQYPRMAISKFTHFFNPMLFPIYDTQVVWEKVLNGIFKNNYRRWCGSSGVRPHETTTESARFNLTYTRRDVEQFTDSLAVQ